LGAANAKYRRQALQTLRDMANDSRWRMREAVCFGLQRVLIRYGSDILYEFEIWVARGTLLETRAVAVAVAEPTILQDMEMATAALGLHRQILKRVIQTPDRRTQDFRTLRQALGFTLSVIVSSLPHEGFEFLSHLAASQDRDVRWIVQQNLKKNRLLRQFPERVATIQQAMQ
jgi:hypothetical protein